MPETPAAHPITFDPALADKTVPEAVRNWAGALRHFARRLPARERAEFFMALDATLYDDHGESAIAAGLHNGLHPKHALMRYHDFFVNNVRAGERVLDLGCGIGALASSIASRAQAHVTGIDWSPKNLDKARAAAKAANLEHSLAYLEGDITAFRAAGSYTTIVLSNVLEHITDRPQRLAMWREWYTPQQFLIRVPAFDRDWRVPWKKQLGVEWRLDPTHETEYTQSQLETELSQAGLKIHSLTIRWGEYWAIANERSASPPCPSSPHRGARL